MADDNASDSNSGDRSAGTNNAGEKSSLQNQSIFSGPAAVSESSDKATPPSSESILKTSDATNSTGAKIEAPPTFFPQPVKFEPRKMDAPSPIPPGLMENFQSRVRDTSDKPAEKASEQTLQSLEAARNRLRENADKFIINEADRTKFKNDMETFEKDYLKRTVKTSDAAAREIARTMDNVSRILETESSVLTDAILEKHLKNPADTPFRIRLAEQVLRHCAEPTSIDQGRLPLCQIEALQVRTCCREPAAVSQLVSEVFLTGTFSSGGKSLDVAALVGKRGDVLLPDSESQDVPGYKRPDSAGRDYASKIFDITGVNLCFEKSKPGTKYVEDGENAYVSLPNGSKTYIRLQGKNGKVETNLLPEVDTANLTEAYQRITDTKEYGFFVVGKMTDKDGRVIESKYNPAVELMLTPYPEANLVESSDLPAVLSAIKNDKLWPPILSLKSELEPVCTQYKSVFTSAQGSGYHFAVCPETSADRKLCSLDGTWSKKADHLNVDIPTQILAQSVMKSAPKWETVDLTKPENYVDKAAKIDNTNFHLLKGLQTWIDSPSFQSYKKGWFEGLPAMVKQYPNDALKRWTDSHPTDLRAKDWYKAHPEDSDGSAFIKRMQAFCKKYKK